MRTVKTALKIGLLAAAILIVLGIYLDRRDTAQMLCRITYNDFDSEIRAALRAEGIDKLAHLQAAQMNMQILYQKDCCKYESTCPGGIKL
jgi:hypothetical protein